MKQAETSGRRAGAAHARRVGRYLVVAVVAVGGCKPRSTNGLRAEDTSFVATMAELRAVGANRQLDSAARAAARTAVLQRRGLTVAALEARARTIATDPRRAAAVWDAVNKRADSVQSASGAAASTPPPSAPRPPRPPRPSGS